MQSLCHNLKEDFDIGANFYLVGSGEKNLILQNTNNPVDLDYNLEIVRCEDFYNCRHLKECTRKAFNKALRSHGQSDCDDSKSSLTTKKSSINPLYLTDFSIDVCIVTADTNGNLHRLIHKKTGYSCCDEYYWNIAPSSKELKQRANYIKKCGKWELVRQQYLEIKNRYLKQNDPNHPSFICYIEAVNNVYNSQKHR